MSKKTAQEAQTETTDAPLDPESIVELQVVDRRNAGVAPTTAWGKVSFDADGVGTIKVPLKDIHRLHELHWLSAEDQAKYLGISQEAAAVSTSADVTDLTSQLEATKSANVRMAQRNAELEAKMDEVMSKYQKEYLGYQAQVSDQMKHADERIAQLQSENDTLVAQVNDLTTKLAAATPVVADTETEKATKAAAKKDK